MTTKSKPIRFAVGGLVLAVCLAPGLRADDRNAERGPSGADRFPISVASIEARRPSVFAEVDGNGDGLISESEFVSHEPSGDGRFHRFHKEGPRGMPPGMRPDAPADDESRADRMAAMDDALFAALDSNGDGTLARSEFNHDALMAARRTQMKQEMFTRLDEDSDGFLSPEEFPPTHLASLDADGDGEISRDEMRHRRDKPPAG